jgi:hypothetical protein
VIGVADAVADAEPLPEALADGDVLVLVLLLLLVQAARAPTESATALMAMAFLENQGRLDLNARFLLPYRSGFFGIEPVSDIGVLTFEGYTGRLRLLRDERREINVTVTPADESLNQLMHNRGHGHRNLAFPRSR